MLHRHVAVRLDGQEDQAAAAAAEEGAEEAAVAEEPLDDMEV